MPLTPHPARTKPYPPYPGFKAYPRWVDTLSGHRMVVRDHIHEEQLTGFKMNEDGSFAEEDEKPAPPTLDEVHAAGCTGEAAQRIVNEEAEAYKKGYEPYGDKPRPKAVQSGHGTQVVTIEKKTPKPVTTPLAQGIAMPRVPGQVADVHEDPLG